MRAALALALLLTACGGAATTPETHPITSKTLTLVDATRPTPANGTYAGAATRTLVTELWYPTTADGQLLAGKHPLIFFSHGFMDNRLGETYLAEHLASAGYVVAAPDYPLSSSNAPGGATVLDIANQPLDLRFVIDSLLADPTWQAAIDETRIGAAGLSLGGLTTLLAGYHHTLRDPRLRGLFTMAAPACMFLPAFYSTSLPLYALHGDSDLIVPFVANGERLFERAPEPRHLVVFKQGTHTGFAGLAALFDSGDHYDNLGCTAIGMDSGSSGATLGADDAGISKDPTSCPARCTTTGTGPVLSATRQQAITKQAARAFFDDLLRDDKAAHETLATGLANDHPEIAIR